MLVLKSSLYDFDFHVAFISSKVETGLFLEEIIYRLGMKQTTLNSTNPSRSQTSERQSQNSLLKKVISKIFLRN